MNTLMNFALSTTLLLGLTQSGIAAAAPKQGAHSREGRKERA